MTSYKHYVLGFFASREESKAALVTLIERELPSDRMQIFGNDAALPAGEGSNEVLKDVLVDGAIGTAVGTGIGALAELALVATNVSLFVASPVIAPLAMLGWGASLGGLIGAAVGAEKKDGSYSALIRDAVANGHYVLLVETWAERETAVARKVIEEAVGEVRELATA